MSLNIEFISICHLVLNLYGIKVMNNIGSKLDSVRDKAVKPILNISNNS